MRTETLEMLDRTQKTLDQLLARVRMDIALINLHLAALRLQNLTHAIRAGSDAIQPKDVQ